MSEEGEFDHTDEEEEEIDVLSKVSEENDEQLENDDESDEDESEKSEKPEYDEEFDDDSDVDTERTDDSIEVNQDHKGMEGDEDEDEAESSDGDCDSKGTEIADDDDDGLSVVPLSVLTQAQVEILMERKEKEVRKCKNNIVNLRIKKEAMEMKKHKTIHEEERFQETIKLLKEEETYLHSLLKRMESLKKLQHDGDKLKSSERFEASKIPQIILCSTWDDSKMPKVVVCSTPRIGRMERLTTEFLKVLSPQQVAIIEKEKQWMAIECGKVRLQIAGIKGKVKVMTKENEVLKTLVDTTETPDEINVVLPDDVDCSKPCMGPKGIPGKARRCSKLQQSKSLSTPPLELQLETFREPKRQTISDEIAYIEHLIRNLQVDLDNAMADKRVIADQKERLLNLGESLSKIL